MRLGRHVLVLTLSRLQKRRVRQPAIFQKIRDLDICKNRPISLDISTALAGFAAKRGQTWTRIDRK